jgi:hypothetical protein
MGKKAFITIIVLVIQLGLVNGTFAQEAEVTVLGVEKESGIDIENVKKACDLLGVKAKINLLRTANAVGVFDSNAELYDKDVLILTERAFRSLGESIIREIGQRDRKILVLGLTPEKETTKLKVWSEMGMSNVREFDVPSGATSIRIVKNDAIMKELGGLEYPLVEPKLGKINGFELAGGLESVSLAEVVDESGNVLCALFVKGNALGGNVFLLASWEKLFWSERSDLYRILPILVFLKYCFGDRSWHRAVDHANLTIDDPWLREPYGYISFGELCSEAEKSGFHVTTGFIPFNYQRSDKDVIGIFRRCQNRLSIAVHGNNHDFKEFWRSEDEDERDVIQGLYRMDVFKQETQLSFDKVMIFPRGRYTKNSLRPLKKHNFLMTVNGGKPQDELGERSFSDKIDEMRGITLEFEGFPVVLRSRIADWPNDEGAFQAGRRMMQMRLFLDLPVLIYAHHDFFSEGIERFNFIARTINEMQPQITWASLGDIGKKLYFQKRISDREIEILSLTSDIKILNENTSKMKYVVRKKEEGSIAIHSVEVDGVRHDYSIDRGHVRVDIVIEPGCEKNLRIVYSSDSKTSGLEVNDKELQARVIRALSDFRDIYLPRVPFGAQAVTIFYFLGGVRNVAMLVAGLTATILILVFLRVKGRVRQRK